MIIFLCWLVFPSLSGQFFASSLLLSHQLLLLGAPFPSMREVGGRFGWLHLAEFATVSSVCVQDVLFTVSGPGSGNVYSALCLVIGCPYLVQYLETMGCSSPDLGGLVLPCLPSHPFFQL